MTPLRLSFLPRPVRSSLGLFGVLAWCASASAQAPEPPTDASPAPPSALPRAPTAAPTATPLAARPGTPPATNAPQRAPAPTEIDAPGRNPVPPLSVVLKQANARAPQVRLGTAALEVSRTSQVNARRPGLGNPYIEVVGQHGSNGTTQGISWNGTVWLPLELTGQRSTRIAEADAYEELFEKSLETAEASALGETITAYGAAQVAAERVRVLEQIVSMSKATADIYEARLEAGDAILRDVTLARVDLARNQVLLQDARGRLAIALAELNRLTGSQYDSASHDDLTPPIELDRYLRRAAEELPPAVATSEAEAKYYEAQRARIGKEAVGPFSLMLMGGRGDFGETRLGAGIAYEFPVLRSQQGEKARADAERLRAQTEASVRRAYVDSRLRGIAQQFRQDQQALEVLSNVALPAADSAVEASMATLQAGKDDWFVVLISRRDQAMLRLQRLDLLERQWSLLGEMVQLTGELP